LGGDADTATWPARQGRAGSVGPHPFAAALDPQDLITAEAKAGFSALIAIPT